MVPVTHLFKLVPLGPCLSHDKRHSPQDEVELLPRLGETAHGERLVRCLEAVHQRGQLERDRWEGVLKNEAFEGR